VAVHYVTPDPRRVEIRRQDGTLDRIRPGGLVTACNITVRDDMLTTSRHRDVTCDRCIEKILYD
jgi:hypothetical protein